MTVTFPDGIDAQGNAALWFLPAIGNTTTGPTLAEFTAGVNLSCAIDGFSAPSEQASTNDIRYCSTQQFETPGRVTTTIDPINYVYDPQDPDNATEYKHYSTLVAGLTGYLVNRLGVNVNTAPVAAQVVDLYPVTAGVQARMAIDASAEGSKIKVTQKFFVTGPVKYDVPVHA